MSPLMRNILGQSRHKVNLASIMNEGKVLIVNLSKGKIGEDNAHFLGSLFVTYASQVAMARAHIPAEQRKDFTVIVDEFQSFGTNVFASMLSEARKYRLSVVLAHQFTSQLSEEVQKAVLGNVGTMMAFRVGSEDAEILSRHLGEKWPPSLFVAQSNFRAYVASLQNGDYAEPFALKTMPPNQILHQKRRAVVSNSRNQYGTKREQAEKRIARWMNNAA